MDNHQVFLDHLMNVTLSSQLIGADNNFILVWYNDFIFQMVTFHLVQ